MKRIAVIACALALGMGCGIQSAAAQETPRFATARAGETKILDPRLVPAPADVRPPAAEQPRLVLAKEIGVARGKRPWWLIPVIGAAAGAVVYEIARGDECENTDCIIYIPPPVQGAVLGLAAGSIVEIVLRVSER